jgi:hypothetical protein
MIVLSKAPSLDGRECEQQARKGQVPEASEVFPKARRVDGPTRLEPNDPEQEKKRDGDQSGDQQRAKTSQTIREEKEHAPPALKLRGGLSFLVRLRS